VTLTGKQKAAMLLMSLDAGTAAELLRDVGAETVRELAVELAYLDAAGYRSSQQSAEIARQFVNSLRSEPEFHIKSFLKEMLENTIGAEKAQQVQTQIQDLLKRRDPFIAIRSIDSQRLASVLENEHPQAVAVVLSELQAKKSSEVLGLLGEGIRLSAVGRMTSCEAVTTEARSRIAETVCRRLEAVAAGGEGGAVQARPEQSLRKVAVILRNLGKELRDGLVGAIKEKDGQAGEMVGKLMIVWEDIPQITDRSLQGGLRGIDAQKLALALVKADDAISKKIRSNISERAAAAIEEEASLMSAPRKKDIEEAREGIVQILREMNEKGELLFVEE